jgi:O-acetyl-ADP-ribose deacetylase (regulator of RNase III)
MQVVEGSVFDGTSDWLVNPCNQQATLYWGSHISEHIHRHAGPTVKEERRRAGHLPLGGTCLTSGGSLRHPHIIHVAVFNAWSLDIRYLFGLRKRIDASTLHRGFDSLWSITEQHGIQQADLPAFWLGKNGWDWPGFVHEFGEHPLFQRTLIHRLSP